MRQPHENENPGAAATASGQIANQSNSQIALAVPIDKLEHSAILRACREVAERKADRGRS